MVPKSTTANVRRQFTVLRSLPQERQPGKMGDQVILSHLCGWARRAQGPPWRGLQEPGPALGEGHWQPGGVRGGRQPVEQQQRTGLWVADPGVAYTGQKGHSRGPGEYPVWGRWSNIVNSELSSKGDKRG